MDREIITFLGQNELFSGMTEQQLEVVAKHLTIRKYVSKERIFSRGEIGREFFIVRSGMVEIFVPDPPGPDMVLEVLKPQGAFGELALLNEEARTASARAIKEVELIIFNRVTFLALMQKLPSVGFGLSRILALRLKGHALRKGVQFVNLSKVERDSALFQKLPKQVMAKNKVVPIREDDATITIAMVNPFDVVAFDDVSRHIQDKQVEIVAVSEDDFNKFYTKTVSTVLDVQQGQPHDMLPAIPQKKEYKLKFVEEYTESSVISDEKGGHVSGEQVIQLVNQILGEALDFDSSDIHIEPQEDKVSIRYRIDGKLMRRAEVLPIRFFSPLLTRLKVLARMDITEKRKPQDGRIAIFRNNREIDFRLSTLPTRFGEKIVMRVLDRSSFLVNLNRLFVIDHSYEIVKSMVSQPYGIVFVVGPTGSGKTTTMYSALMERKEEGINIVTVEDPIEYTIQGITQVQINESVNFGFSEAIRSFLRQDPDIIMVGETRDVQTARNAMTAALMGHLVFTSLHANDALGTILRLRDIGIETFLIANAFVGAIYQRLLRRICQVCRTEHEYDEDLLRRVRITTSESSEKERYFLGKGCHACNGTGFRGRIAAYEVLRINEELRHLISIGADTAKLRDSITHGNMVSLKYYCHDLLKLGLTTPQDVLRILYSDED